MRQFFSALLLCFFYSAIHEKAYAQVSEDCRATYEFEKLLRDVQCLVDFEECRADCANEHGAGSYGDCPGRGPCQDCYIDCGIDKERCLADSQQQFYQDLRDHCGAEPPAPTCPGRGPVGGGFPPIGPPGRCGPLPT